jgi:hypothetical protein
MTTDRALNWILGACYVFMFFMYMSVSHERDSVRRAIVETSDSVITVTCKEQSHD